MSPNTTTFVRLSASMQNAFKEASIDAGFAL